jgi:UDP-N-acetylmuramate dehydrogenase
VRLSDLTTLRLGGPAASYTEATSVEELTSAPRDALIVGGGSNLVVSDEGYDGPVVHVATRGVSADHEGSDPTCGGVLVTVAAGESWDSFVSGCVENGWVGVEALSGIPGLVGATPIQNVGAYGQEVSQTIARVRVWDRVMSGFRTFAAA